MMVHRPAFAISGHFTGQWKLRFWILSPDAAATVSPCPWELVRWRKLSDLGLNQTLKILVGHFD